MMRDDVGDLAFRSLDSLEGAPDRLGGAPGPREGLVAKARRYAPGVIIAGLVALAAQWLSEHYKAPVMLFALLLGMAVNFTGDDPRCRPGIDFAARQILRIGVALLGMRITFDQVRSVGAGALTLTAVAVVLTILIGWLMARSMKLRGPLGILMGGAVAICGASAALAIASVLPRSETHERDVVLTVVGVTTLSTLAMILYPTLAAMLHFSDVAAGMFFGATIHDVAQVVGAGYSVSPEAGDTATIVKLFRVALLLPAVVIISLIYRRSAEANAKRPPLIPMFLIAFAVLVAINSTGMVGDWIRDPLQDASRWCLVTAIAALGAKTALGDLAKVGWRPILVLVGTTVFVAAFVLGGMALMGGWPP